LHVVLHDAETDKVVGLDGVAADMWRALAAYGDPEAAMDYLLAHYEVDEGVLRSDLDRFIAELVDRGLLDHQAQDGGKGG